MALEPGAVRLRGASRSFRIAHERNATLKEALIRRRRGSFTDLWALRNVDLDIAPGDSLGIIGQNGSGKSTLLKLIAGILPPQEGTIEVGGTVASMLELGAGFHPDFTGRENVFMNGSIYGLSEGSVAKRLDSILDFAELHDFIDMPVKTYSSGMQMRLAFAVASHVNPDILLLDEVLAVGDEAFQRKCFGRIFDYRRRGGTIVLVSHDPAAIERVCDRVIMIRDGTVIEDGPPNQVLPLYHRSLADAPHADQNSKRDGDAPDDNRTWGNREVIIDEVQLVGPDGPTDRFMSGDSLTIELSVTAQRPVETPIFGIALHTAEGALMYGTNTRMDALPLDMLHGSATVRFTVPAIGLHEGQFTLTVAAHSYDEQTVYHWRDRLTEFSVFQARPGVGPVELAGDWSVQPGPQTERSPSFANLERPSLTDS